MRNWVLLFLSLPCAVACASVLGLEDAELESSGGSCNYGVTETNGDSCIADCWNSSCCSEAIDCLDDPDGACIDYRDCAVTCDDTAADCRGECDPADSACRADCTSSQTSCRADCTATWSDGVQLARALATCTASCGCGGGGGNDDGTPCNAGDPAACVSSSSVQICIDGAYQTETCSALCDTLGYRPGACSGSGCNCGAALDPDCDAGANAYCVCAEAGGDPCTTETLLTAYAGCYTGDATIEPVILCLADFYANGSIDCASASVCLP